MAASFGQGFLFFAGLRCCPTTLATMTVLSFSDGYKKYFEVVPAISEELKRHNFRLRHEVYCRDLGFEPENAEGIEHDRFDRHSAHCLIRSRASTERISPSSLLKKPSGSSGV